MRIEGEISLLDPIKYAPFFPCAYLMAPVEKIYRYALELNSNKTKYYLGSVYIGITSLNINLFYMPI